MHNARNIRKQEHLLNDGRYYHNQNLNRQHKQSIKAIHQLVMKTQITRAMQKQPSTQLPNLPKNTTTTTVY